MAFRIKERDLPEYRWIAFWILLFIMTPAVFIGSIGVLMLAFSRATVDIVLGVLVLSFVAALAAGATVTMFHLRRRAREHTLQRDFVSKVSHELRTPLTSLRMFIETLQMGRLDENPIERREALNFMASETERLTVMINRLLDWGQIEAGKRLYKHEVFPVGELLARAEQSVAAARVLHPFELKVDIDPGFPLLRGDRDALAEALGDLLQNSVKYTGQDKDIEFSARQDAAHLYLSISDNGRGIPKREHKRIFEKFYRPADPLIRDIEGSGLGLSMVQSIVQAHRGWVNLHSDIGVGSKFTIVLPKKQCAAEAATI